MSKSVLLSNGCSWKTQTEAKEHFRQMLARYKTGDQISSPDDHSDLCALLVPYDACLDPGQPTKIGVGIDHFSRQVNIGPKWSSPGFHVHRIDGTSIDFSFIEAVKAAST
jgi:Protein of unknown function (DUF3223)